MPAGAVRLSGKQGTGKTLFTKVVSQKAREEGIPTIIIQNYFNGIEDILSAIDQRCLVIFDEFEKNYNVKQQEALLPLFDGLLGGEKLFLVTCNMALGLSCFIKDRPGRFLYHFKFGDLTVSEIQEYLSNNLSEKYKDLLGVLSAKCILSRLSYDSLRAVTQEINNGFGIDETFCDMNIQNVTGFKVGLTMENNTPVWSKASCTGNTIYCNTYIYKTNGMYSSLKKKAGISDCGEYIRLQIQGELSKVKCDANGQCTYPWNEALCEWSTGYALTETALTVKYSLEEIFSSIKLVTINTEPNTNEEEDMELVPMPF